MTRNWLLTVALLLVLFPGGAPAESGKNFVVIVHKDNKLGSLTRSKLRFIYGRKVSRWPWGAEIRPLDLPENFDARQRFSQSILGRSIEEMAIYWIDQKITRNANPPQRVLTVEAAKALVATTAGAIAYVPATAVDDTVKVLEIE